MTDIRKIELIEKSHFNQLSKAERRELEQCLAQDASFAQEATETEELFQGLGALALEDFESQMGSWEDKHRHTQKAKVRKMTMASKAKSNTLRRFLRVAAVILVLFLPVAYFISSGGFSNSTSNEELFQAYYGEGPQFMDLRLRGDDAVKSDVQRELENRKRHGLTLFNKSDYKMAIHHLNIYVENSPNRDYAAILSLATAQLAQKEVDKAIPLYELIIETKEATAQPFQNQATWYLALAQLRNNELPAAQMQLKQLSQNEHSDYQEAAKKLLKEIQERE